jgi:hypothetical protein
MAKKIGEFLDAMTGDQQLADDFIADPDQTMIDFGLDEDQRQKVSNRNLHDLANAVWAETPNKQVHVKLRPVRH